MQRKPDGSRRLVIAYVSIGEAETYRYYWETSWKFHPPEWLDKENPDWPDNYKVHYWDPRWRRIIFGSPSSYLDRVIAAGFDGAFLDIVDAFEYYRGKRPQAADEMIDFVDRLSRYAKAKKPGFLILPQNGESLLSDPRYRSSIDGIVKEDLFYGVGGDGVKNRPDEIAYNTSFLEKAAAAGKPIFIVEYVARPSQISDVYRRAREAGFIPYATRRDLSSITLNKGWDPGT